MGVYDFDSIIDRKHTGSLKYDSGLLLTGRDDLLPMWVADMDFRIPDEILQAVHERVEHGIFGYTTPTDRYGEVLEGWFRRRYGVQIDRAWNTVVPGVVYAISCALRAITEPGDAVVIQEPVYYPFRGMIEQNGRVCVNNQLRLEDGVYTMDMDDLEEVIRSHHPKAMILCSPHNPVGRVWKRDELAAVDELCRRYQVRLLVDEIHCDFIYPGHVFTPFLSLGEESAHNAIICTSPSKSFNLAGLQISNILIPDAKLRKAFRKEHSANGCGQGNALGLAAAEAAYEKGDRWLDELLVYLRGNVACVRDFLESELPRLRLIEPEGTYLLWVDFSGAVSDSKELEHLIRDRAKLWLDSGDMFSRETPLFERINIACPRSTVEKAMRQLLRAGMDR